MTTYFTPSSQLSANTNPRDWAYELGMLPQDASIVFTKASLIAYLKTHQIEVGSNYAEISKVPRYATIGNMREASVLPENQAVKQAEFVKQEAPATFSAPPREAPSAPLQSQQAIQNPTVPAAPVEEKSAPPMDKEMPKAMTSSDPSSAIEVKTADGNTFRPTRRVREPIGGGSAQIGALFGMGSDEHDEAVREAERENARRKGLLITQETVPSPKFREVESPLQPSKMENQPIQAPAINIKSSTVFRPSRRVR